MPRKMLQSLESGREVALRVTHDDDTSRVECDDPAFEAEVVRRPSGLSSILVGGRSYEAFVEVRDGELLVEFGGERFRFGENLVAGASGGTSSSSGRAEVKAPMPGKVVKLLVQPGDAVTSGQGVLLFEAMKMQNEIRSPQDGVVSSIDVQEGQALEARELLFVITAD